jgi:hypothetical protein
MKMYKNPAELAQAAAVLAADHGPEPRDELVYGPRVTCAEIIENERRAKFVYDAQMDAIMAEIERLEIKLGMPARARACRASASVRARVKRPGIK